MLERNGRNFGITNRKKKYLTERNVFDGEFSILRFWAQKGLILKTVRARAKWTKFWDH